MAVPDPGLSAQADLFVDGIPVIVRDHGLSVVHPFPLVSEGKDAGHFATYRVPRELAWGYSEIQIPHAGSVYGALALDVDNVERVEAAILAADVPIPNWQTFRKASGNRHVCYTLKTPVHRYDHARLAPLEYLAWIEAYYAEVIGADRGYNGILTHNPVNDPNGAYSTRWGRPAPYSLEELAEVIPLGWTPPRLHQGAVGRNVDLFKSLMQWAGKRENEAYSVHAAALMLNQEFDCPLPYAEVMSTAMSVDKYRRKWIAHGWHSKRFRARQSARGKASGRVRKAVTVERDAAIRADRKSGMTIRGIAQKHGVSVGTVHRVQRTNTDK